MRHRYKTLKTLKTGVQKKENVVRNLITSFIKHGQIKTTEKKAKILKSEIDKLFNKIVNYKNKYDDKEFKVLVERLANQYLTNDEEAKTRFIMEYVPQIISSGKTTGFVYNYKFKSRQGDNVLEVIVGLDFSSNNQLASEKEPNEENVETK